MDYTREYREGKRIERGRRGSKKRSGEKKVKVGKGSVMNINVCVSSSE